MILPSIDTNYFTTFLVDLLNIAPPTGFAEPAIDFVEKELSKYKQLQISRIRKGTLIAKWKVKSTRPPVALTAHVDTLGAVVKEIKSNGRLSTMYWMPWYKNVDETDTQLRFGVP